jgi:hypothetical protein
MRGKYLWITGGGKFHFRLGEVGKSHDFRTDGPVVGKFAEISII